MKVYRFGLLPPTENAALVRAQMRAAHVYRNVLTEIERGRRAALRALALTAGDVAAAELAVEQTEETEEHAARAVKAAKSATRSTKVPADLKDALTAARVARRDAVHRLQSLRLEARAANNVDAAESLVEGGGTTGHATVDAYLRARLTYASVDGGPNSGARAAARDQLLEAASLVQSGPSDVPLYRVACEDSIRLRAGALCRAARERCGVAPGTYQLVEEAMGAAKKAPLYDGAAPNDPRFVRWTGEGSVGVQMQGGLAVRDVLAGTDTQCQIRVLPMPPGLSERHKPRAEVRLRVGSEGRVPVWATWTAVLHRALPADGTVRRAAVHLRRVGPREQWFLDVVVDAPAGLARCGTGAVAVDLGWRKIGDEIRVAVWRSESGESGEVRLPAKLIGALRKPEDLREIRDREFNKARDALVKWLGAQPAIPDWLKTATSHLGMWRSPARLVTVAQRWRRERFDGDAEGFDALERWRYHDHHLWEWETSQRAKSLGHRREIYRVAAARLAERFGVLALEKFDLRQVARRPAPEGGGENEVARSNRHLAAVSELRDALRLAFLGRGGGEVVEVDAQDTTRTCPVCGLVERFDAAAMVNHTCGGCGTIRDQDEGAAQNILDRWRERQSGSETEGVARGEKSTGKPSRWAKVAEKRAAKEAAREALANQSANG